MRSGSLDSSTPHREAFTQPRHQTVSSHDLDQRAWTSHLAVRTSTSGSPARWLRCERATASLATRTYVVAATQPKTSAADPVWTEEQGAPGERSGVGVSCDEGRRDLLGGRTRASGASADSTATASLETRT